jgi:hypothetical protein
MLVENNQIWVKDEEPDIHYLVNEFLASNIVVLKILECGDIRNDEVRIMLDENTMQPAGFTLKFSPPTPCRRCGHPSIICAANDERKLYSPEREGKYQINCCCYSTPLVADLFLAYKRWEESPGTRRNPLDHDCHQCFPGKKSKYLCADHWVCPKCGSSGGTSGLSLYENNVIACSRCSTVYLELDDLLQQIDAYWQKLSG